MNLNFDFKSIIDQIISYMKSMFSSFSQGGLSENSVIQTISEYVNGVVENFSGAGFDVDELKSTITTSIQEEFAGTPYEDMANDTTKKIDEPEVAYTYNRNKIPTTIGEHPLFELNGIDYTKYIEAPTYKINASEIYEEKTNADKRFIRTVARTRITGTFKLVINEVEVYEKFVSDAWNLKDGYGAVPVNIWVNNMLTYKTNAKVYLTFDQHTYEVPFMGRKKVEGMEITVEEY